MLLIVVLMALVASIGFMYEWDNNNPGWAMTLAFSAICLWGMAGIGVYQKISPARVSIKQTEALLAECEKELPRNKTCKLVAIPE